MNRTDTPPATLPILAAALAMVGLAAVAGALLVHHSCTHLLPGLVQTPVPGTPRAGYCGALDHGAPWLGVLVAVSFAMPVVLLLRRHGWLAVYATAGCLAVACLLLGLATSFLNWSPI